MARARLTNLPIRIAAGVFMVRSGLRKLEAKTEPAGAGQGTADDGRPTPQGATGPRFAKAMGVAEVGLGGALLSPVVVGDAMAGLGLTAFAGGLLGLEARTPGVRPDGGSLPGWEDVAPPEDVWLAGIGLTLLLTSLGGRRRARGRGTTGRDGHPAEAA